MSATRAAGAVLLAVTAALATFSAPSVQAQAASAHEIRRGDTLFGVARRTMHDGVTRNQMILAIYRANQNAFVGGNIHLIEVGTVLTIPARDEVARIASAEADRQVRELLAARAVSEPPPVASARPSAAVPMAGEAAAKRYREGLSMERRGDHRGALAAFLEAGEAGNGMAQLKLGQIYDKGNTAVPRDYQASLKWYQKAREQGVEIDKPLPRMGPP